MWDNYEDGQRFLPSIERILYMQKTAQLDQYQFRQLTLYLTEPRDLKVCMENQLRPTVGTASKMNKRA